MMIQCEYCGGTGKLHDDADSLYDHERDALMMRIDRLLHVLAKAENICLRIDGEGGHGLVLHEMAREFLATIRITKGEP